MRQRMTNRMLTRLIFALRAWLMPAAMVCLNSSLYAIELDLTGSWEATLSGEGTTPVQVPQAQLPAGAPVTYERNFTFVPDPNDDHVLLYFEGVAGTGSVTVNGSPVGDLPSYLPAVFDVTALIETQNENTLALTIDDGLGLDRIPASTTWQTYNGIIRPVRIRSGRGAQVVTVTPQYDFNPELSQVSGVVRLNLRGGANNTVSVAGVLRDGADPNAPAIATLTATPATPATLDANGKAQLELAFALSNPRLWSPASPERYRLDVTTTAAGEVVDFKSIATGFRQVRREGNQLFLNGERLFLRGISRHDLYPNSSHIGSDAQILADLQRLKAAGLNFVRLIHYPHDQRVLEVADELGLLVSCEPPAFAVFWFPVIETRLTDYMQSMLDWYGHHPAIMLWVLGTSPVPPDEYAKRLRDALVAQDSTRLISFAIDDGNFDPDTIARDRTFVEQAGLDVYMKNTYWAEYTAAKQLAWDAFPQDIPLVISEFGFEGNDLTPTLLEPNGPRYLPEDYQAARIRAALETWRPHLPAYDANGPLSGLLLFSDADLPWSEAGLLFPDHAPELHFGLVREDRSPKPALAQVSDFFNTEPNSFIGVPDANDASVVLRFEQPERLPEPVNSAQRESGMAFLPNGLTGIFASDQVVAGYPQLFTSSVTLGTWSVPTPLSTLQPANPNYFTYAPSVSIDGQALYFVRARYETVSLDANGGRSPLLHDARIWVSQRDPNGWLAPQDLGDVINYPDPNVITTDPVLSPDGTVLIFASNRPGGLGGMDLWRAQFDGETWLTPVNLTEMNSPADDCGPAIGPDGRAVYFASNRSGGYGLFDLWVTDFDGVLWSPPRNLGPEINTAGEEYDPYVGPNGEWLYFTGVRPGIAGLVDIFRARRIAAAQILSLNGTWQAFPDPNTSYLVEVPFSVEPQGRVIAYAKTFEVPANLCDGLAMLHFEGVTGKAKIYFNGVFLGEHESYVPFWYDVTALLDPDGPNIIAVETDERADAYTIPNNDIPWLHYVGIPRAVYLTCTDSVEILRSEPQYTLGPDYSTASGTVTVKAAGLPGTVVTFSGELREPAGNLVATLGNGGAITVDPNGDVETTLSFAVNAPQLWSPETPTLYTLTVQAEVDGQVVHTRTVKTGFREVSVHNKRVYLNGQPTLLKGCSRHDLYQDTGYVGTKRQIRSDLLRMKQAGMNFVRLVHYPHPEYVLDVADEIGLMVSEELPAGSEFRDPNIEAKLFDIARVMISRDMHHPSIILWISGTARFRPVAYCTAAQALFKSLDPSRLGSYVIDNDEYDPNAIAEDVNLYHAANLDLMMKITWWFYYLEYLQDAWTNFPDDVPIVIAELGREGNDREPIVVEANGNEFWWGEDQQADAFEIILEAWRPRLWMYNEEKHVAGLCIFNWQDMLWPSIDRFLPNHIPQLNWGLVYEDRAAKLALETVRNFYESLPTSFVGLPQIDSADIEEVFVAPQNMGPSINGARRESGPSLTSDGQRMYIASEGEIYISLPRIYVLDWDGAAWTSPVELSLPLDPEVFSFRRSPCISPEGTTLYFTRALVSGIYVARTRLMKSEYVDGFWTEPVDLGDVVNDPDAARVTSDPTLTGDGLTMYFSSDREGGEGRSDLWKTTWVNGDWTAPVNLGPSINSPHGDSEPSVTPDGQTLYFTSDRPGGQGSSDIWISHWTGSEWSAPKNLGPAFNSIGSEREPEISPDGGTLYFTGERAGGYGLSDLWQATSLCVLSDCDQDGELTPADGEFLWSQLSGPTLPTAAPCDVDRDGDSDITDYLRQQRCLQ